jgi:DNA-3-methyladenine glycosylase I
VGPPVTDERGLFERVSLEAFQSGLSWLTILRKRDAFRAAFAGFEPDAVARFGAGDVERLLGDAGIVRNRAKIEATIANARATVDLRDAGTPLPEIVWATVPPRGPRRRASPTSRPDAGGRGAGQGAQARGLSLRRADHDLRRDAGLRAGQRPPRDVSRRARTSKRSRRPSRADRAALYPANERFSARKGWRVATKARKARIAPSARCGGAVAARM